MFSSVPTRAPTLSTYSLGPQPVFSGMRTYGAASPPPPPLQFLSRHQDQPALFTAEAVRHLWTPEQWHEIHQLLMAEGWATTGPVAKLTGQRRMCSNNNGVKERDEKVDQVVSIGTEVITTLTSLLLRMIPLICTTVVSPSLLFFSAASDDGRDCCCQDLSTA